MPPEKMCPRSPQCVSNQPEFVPTAAHRPVGFFLIVSTPPLKPVLLQKKTRFTSEPSDRNNRQDPRTWQIKNREAINAYNRRIEENGAFSDTLRRF